MKVGFKAHITVVVIVALVFVCYMESIYLPHFNPLMYRANSDLMSYPLNYRNELVGRFLNAGGVLLFCLTFLGGRSLIHLLESLKMDDDLGCISVKGGNWKDEPFNQVD